MEKLSRAYIETLLTRTDKTGMRAVGRALVVLTERHAIYESSFGGYAEGDYGFFAADANIGASMAAYFQRRGLLTPAQLFVWQGRRTVREPRIYKYVDQLMRVAQAKHAPRNPQADLWQQLNLAVWQYYDSLDSDLAEFIDPTEAKVKEIAGHLGMDFAQALNVCGSGEVSGVIKN